MGTHNMLNALAAIASCRAVGVEGQTACRELRDFRLPQRRLERLNPKDLSGTLLTILRITHRGSRSANDTAAGIPIGSAHRGFGTSV